MYRPSSMARPHARDIRDLIHEVVSLKPLNFRIIFIRFVGSRAGSGLWCGCIRVLHGFTSKEHGV